MLDLALALVFRTLVRQDASKGKIGAFVFVLKQRR